MTRKTRDPVENVRLNYVRQTKRFMLSRFGTNPLYILGDKDATNEFWRALAAFAFEGGRGTPGEEAVIHFGHGDEQYLAKIVRLEPKEPLPNDHKGEIVSMTDRKGP